MSARSELHTLEASGLLQVATLEPELEYLFRHALVQDAAYASLLRQDRRALHRLAADTLRTLYPDRARELAAVIGLHLEHAGDAQAAAEQFLVAGDHATERFANRAALAFFDKAEAALPPDQLGLRLHAALGAARSGWTFVGTSAAIERLERAIAAAGELEDRRLLGTAYVWAAFIRRARGEHPDSSPALKHAIDRAAEIGESLGDPIAQVLPKAFLAAGMLFTGELRAGAALLEEALGALGEGVDRTMTAMLHVVLTFALTNLGEFAEAERVLARSEALAATGDTIVRLDTRIARSALLVQRGDIAAGEALATQCALQSEELGAVACVAGANLIVGTAHLTREDALGAKPPLVRSTELAEISGMAPMGTIAQAMLGSVVAQLGDVQAGTAGWNVALERAGAMHDRYGEATTVWMRARTALRATPPDWSAAIADLDRATALFEAMETRPALARTLRDRAQALRGLGRTADAAEAERRSRALAAELGLKDFAT